MKTNHLTMHCRKIITLLFVLIAMYPVKAQIITPNYYTIGKTLSNYQINACLQFGYVTNTGYGTYARIRATAHNCNQLFIAEYEVFGTYYAGAVTDWMEVPLRNGNDYNGVQNMALDVRLTANGGNFELRLRRLSGGCADAAVNFQIYIETNGSFVEIQTEELATTPPTGYLGKTSGWQFPVGVNRFANSIEGLFINNAGNVGIGTLTPLSKLSVNGEILAKKVKVSQTWADYVFDSIYKLPSLAEVQNYIKYNKHLPGIPTASEVEANGLDLGDMCKLQQEKIEQLTLYLIQQQQAQDRLEKKLEKQEEMIRALYNKIKEIKEES
jgi:hypothetical protein